MGTEFTLRGYAGDTKTVHIDLENIKYICLDGMGVTLFRIRGRRLNVLTTTYLPELGETGQGSGYYFQDQDWETLFENLIFKQWIQDGSDVAMIRGGIYSLNPKFYELSHGKIFKK